MASGLLPIRISRQEPPQELVKVGYRGEFFFFCDDNSHWLLDQNGHSVWLGLKSDSLLPFAPEEHVLIDIEKTFYHLSAIGLICQGGKLLDQFAWSESLDTSDLVTGLVARIDDLRGLSLQVGQQNFEVYSNGQAWAPSLSLALSLAEVLLQVY